MHDDQVLCGGICVEFYAKVMFCFSLVYKWSYPRKWGFLRKRSFAQKRSFAPTEVLCGLVLCVKEEFHAEEISVLWKWSFLLYYSFVEVQFSAQVTISVEVQF